MSGTICSPEDESLFDNNCIHKYLGNLYLPRGKTFQRISGYFHCKTKKWLVSRVWQVMLHVRYTLVSNIYPLSNKEGGSAEGFNDQTGVCPGLFVRLKMKACSITFLSL